MNPPSSKFMPPGFDRLRRGMVTNESRPDIHRHRGRGVTSTYHRGGFPKVLLDHPRSVECGSTAAVIPMTVGDRHA